MSKLKVKKYRLKEVRDEYNDINADKGNKITVEYMAKYCNVGMSTISRIEREQTEPTPDVLIGYANTFNVSLEYLLGCSDAKNMKNYTVNHELGLSDSTIEILKKIKNSPDNSYLLDIINAIIGNDKYTIDFLVGLFNCMVDEQILLNTKSGAQKTELRQNQQEEKILSLQDGIKRLEAKVTTHDDNYFTIAGYASLRGLNVDTEKAKMLGKKAVKLSGTKRYKISQVKDTKYGKVNAYHTDILKEVFDNA